MERPIEIGAISARGEAYLAGRLRQAKIRGEFRPSRREDVRALAGLSADDRRAAARSALEALRAGSAAYGILAAGASTRMDLAAMPERARRLLERSGRSGIGSKALVPVVEIDGRVLSFLDLFFVNVARFSAEIRTANPVLLLLSEANAPEIEGYLVERGRFGLSAESVITFCQSLDSQLVATAADVERAYRNFASEADFQSALSVSRAFAGHDLAVRKPGGHGEFLHQMISSGTLGRLCSRGVRYVSVRNIDNVGATLDESWLAILGRMIEGGSSFLVEVSRRPDGPAGKGGALIVKATSGFELAEDPSFEGTGVDPRQSYYINDATAILDTEYLFQIYETSVQEISSASPERLAEIAERGRRKFPALIDVKPVRLRSGHVVGAFAAETNLWESTGVEENLGVDAIAVASVKDVEEGFDDLPPAEQARRAVEVRFAAAKKWEDYEGVNARLMPYLARKILTAALVESSLSAD